MDRAPDFGSEPGVTLRPTQSENSSEFLAFLDPRIGPGRPRHSIFDRASAQVGLPHRKPEGTSFVRQNGDLTFSITAHPAVGLPYGRYPRLLLIWITTEAVRRKSPVLQLGPSLTGFMAQHVDMRVEVEQHELGAARA